MPGGRRTSWFPERSRRRRPRRPPQRRAVVRSVREVELYSERLRLRSWRGLEGMLRASGWMSVSRFPLRSRKRKLRRAEKLQESNAVILWK